MRSYFTRKNLTFALCAVCILLSQTGLSQTPPQTAADYFRNGLAAFQKNDFEAARTEFTNAVKLEPNNADVLYNLGLTEYKAKNEGLALGLWRKALVLDPGNDDVTHAIAYGENALPQKAVARGSDLFESFRKAFLIRNSLLGFLTINLVLFAFAGWILIRYFAARSRSLENEEPSPPVPYVGILFVFLFLIASALVAAKLYDLSIPRGTITAEKLEVKTSPDAASATLFELFEGFEVIVRQSSQDWLQINYPGGLSGWVPANAVFQTGRQP